jgi:cell pole-organizing protein PopZ
LIRRFGAIGDPVIFMRGAFRAKRQNSMSAANASASSRMFQDEARANEPSMEEILASIRRIIADDEGMPGVRRDVRRRMRADVDDAPGGRSAYPAPVLERFQDEPPLPPADSSNGEREETGALRLLYDPDDMRPEPETASSEAKALSEGENVTEQHNPEADAAEPAFRDRPLLSPESAATVASQFRTLAAGVAFSESDILDRCAQDMLRPMVEQWLNENLPSLVERLVRGEIERITRAGSRVPTSAEKSIQP